jgi:hypothetical protein
MPAWQGLASYERIPPWRPAFFCSAVSENLPRAQINAIRLRKISARFIGDWALLLSFAIRNTEATQDGSRFLPGNSVRFYRIGHFVVYHDEGTNSAAERIQFTLAIEREIAAIHERAASAPP